MLTLDDDVREDEVRGGGEGGTGETLACGGTELSRDTIASGRRFSGDGTGEAETLMGGSVVTPEGGEGSMAAEMEGKRSLLSVTEIEGWDIEVVAEEGGGGGLGRLIGVLLGDSVHEKKNSFCVMCMHTIYHVLRSHTSTVYQQIFTRRGRCLSVTI